MIGFQKLQPQANVVDAAFLVLLSIKRNNPCCLLVRESFLDKQQRVSELAVILTFACCCARQSFDAGVRAPSIAYTGQSSTHILV